jgi:hypothetical protein
MLYRLLRPDEDWQLGVSAKDPNSTKSVFGLASTQKSLIFKARTLMKELYT